MFIYQIHMPHFVQNILEDSTFIWLLTPHIYSKERYMELKCFQLGGYQFDAIIFNFYERKITIFLQQYNLQAVQQLLNNFSVCSGYSLSFPAWKNKKSYTLLV